MLRLEKKNTTFKFSGHQENSPHYGESKMKKPLKPDSTMWRSYLSLQLGTMSSLRKLLKWIVKLTDLGAASLVLNAAELKSMFG